MALWKEPEKSPASPSPNPRDRANFGSSDTVEPAVSKSSARATEAARSVAKSDSASHIAPDLVIEGKIEGAGHVHIAGRFKGDINVRGDLTIEDGAKVEGSIRAERVTISGELIGNIETAAHVELMQTGALTGDVKSRTFSVAKGSKMRGQTEFGWDDGNGNIADIRKGNSRAGDNGLD